MTPRIRSLWPALLIVIVFFLIYYGSEKPPIHSAPPGTMTEGVHYARIFLPDGQNHQRIPIALEGIQGGYDWKVLSWIRTKPTWIEPNLFQLDQHPRLASSLMILKSPDWKETTVIYPVGSLDVNHDLVYEDGYITANLRRVKPEGELYGDVVAVHSNTRGKEGELVRIAVEKARELVGGRTKEDTTGFFDGLGVCTWEALQGKGRITGDLVLGLIPDIPIQTFLIDDGWQDVSSSRGLVSFQGYDGMGAPMSEIIRKIKDKANNCAVGVWVTLQGYWIAIDKDSPLIAKYNCVEHQRAKWGEPRGGIQVPLTTSWTGTQWFPHPDKAEQFWLDYFGEMKSMGIDFVKVDNQADYDAIVSDTSELTQQAMWSGMLSAAEKVYGIDKIINCMSHNERMLNGPGGLDFSRPNGNLVYRNSDDFNLKYDMAHPDFIKYNLYSTILTSQLSLTPDFDMFSTADSQLPKYHALLRVLGPGPFLLSDAPGVETDRHLLGRMTSNHRAVRSQRPASVLPRRWFWDNLQGAEAGPALIAGVALPEANGAMLGAWNLRNPKKGEKAVDTITKEDLIDLVSFDNHREYVLYPLGLSSGSQEIQRYSERSSDSEGVHLELGKAECEGFVLCRIWKISGGREIAVLGMLEKLAPLAQLRVEEHGGDVVVTSSFTESISVLMMGLDVHKVKAYVDGKELKGEKKDVSIGVICSFVAQEAGVKITLR